LSHARAPPRELTAWYPRRVPYRRGTECPKPSRKSAPALDHPLALTKAKALLAKHGKEGHGLRVGVRGGGCSGLSYMLDFESAEKKGDQVMEFDGLRIYLDIKSQLFLAGTTLDYATSLMDTGFKFVNPNAKRSCSCGESFSV
jgi:iron-sulfur cluster assembly protein